MIRVKRLMIAATAAVQVMHFSRGQKTVDFGAWRECGGLAGDITTLEVTKERLTKSETDICPANTRGVIRLHNKPRLTNHRVTHREKLQNEMMWFWNFGFVVQPQRHKT